MRRRQITSTNQHYGYEAFFPNTILKYLQHIESQLMNSWKPTLGCPSGILESIMETPLGVLALHFLASGEQVAQLSNFVRIRRQYMGYSQIYLARYSQLEEGSYLLSNF